MIRPSQLWRIFATKRSCSIPLPLPHRPAREEKAEIPEKEPESSRSVISAQQAIDDLNACQCRMEYSELVLRNKIITTAAQNGDPAAGAFVRLLHWNDAHYVN